MEYSDYSSEFYCDFNQGGWQLFYTYKFYQSNVNDFRKVSNFNLGYTSIRVFKFIHGLDWFRLLVKRY